ncbi:hypothetical protein [Nocardioides sp. SR21]|uniref:hypothetical protein n=1 Tax=Nocardioides sp. SR21 TaxID=2919501 RepID=UPI001FAB19B8|nr:hypothetical protein [Nocardioides sp. SR21]
MSEFDMTEGIQPDEEPDAEEFEGTEPGEDSDDTGTHYDELGEAETTANDVEADAEDQE